MLGELLKNGEKRKNLQTLILTNFILFLLIKYKSLQVYLNILLNIQIDNLHT